jgi:hypothetical protein
MVRHSLEPLVYRRVSSWTRTLHCLSTSSRHQLTSTTLLDKPWSFASAISRAWRVSTNLPSRKATFQATSSSSPRMKSNEVVLSNASYCTLSWASLIEVLTLSLTMVASCTKVVIACTTLCPGHLLLKPGHIICVLSQTLRESKGRGC